MVSQQNARDVSGSSFCHQSEDYTLTLNIIAVHVWLNFRVRLPEDHSSKTQCSRKSLNKEDLAICRHTTKNTSHEYTNCKELRNLKSELGAGVHQRPEEAGGQEAIVETLISGHVLRFGGKVGLECECSQTCR